MPQGKIQSLLKSKDVDGVLFCFFWVFFLNNMFILCELLGQSFRHILVGRLDLAVSRAGVGEFIALVGVLQVPPHARHVRGDVVVAVLFSNNLGEKTKTCFLAALCCEVRRTKLTSCKKRNAAALLVILRG